MQLFTWSEFEAMYAVPMLVLRGELSDLFSADAATRMVSGHPDAKLVTVANVGHAPLLDEPEALQAIRAFLTRTFKKIPK